MYLADLYPQYGLSPANDDPMRAVYNQWMLFLADSIYPVYCRIAHPDSYSTDPSHGDEIKTAAELEQIKQWTVVEECVKKSALVAWRAVFSC